MRYPAPDDPAHLRVLRILGVLLALLLPVGLAGIASVSAAPLATATTIEVYAWPDDAAQTSTPIGGTVPLTLVGQTTTTTGNFSVALSGVPTTDPTVQLETIASIGGVISSITNESVASSTTTLPGSLSAMTSASGTVVNAATTDATPEAGGGCLPHKVTDYNDVWTTVGAAYASVDGGTDTFIYGNGQSSSLGIGISDNTGAAGTYSESGTNSQSSGGEIDYPTYGFDDGSHYFNTQFDSTEYEVICSDGDYWYQLQSTGWVAASESPGTAIVYAPYCDQEEAGVTVKLDSTTASAFVAGFNILGIAALSAQTGFSTTADMQFKFNTALELCGTLNQPGLSNAGKLQVD